MSDEEPVKPALDVLDIEWLSKWVCEETFQNRQRLREADYKWRVVEPDAETHIPSGLIEVLTPEIAATREMERNKDILVDPKDPWSDFVPATEIPQDATGVPFWIYRRVERWNEWYASTGKPVDPAGPSLGAVAKARKGKEPYLPVRCKIIKPTGFRCSAWATIEASNGICRAHAPGAALAADMGHTIALAKIKVMQAMPAMVDELEMLAMSAASEQVRLKAITEMMDRGGVNASTDINVTGGIEIDHNPGALIRDRLKELAERLGHAEDVKHVIDEKLHPGGSGDSSDIVDAEIVSDPAEPEEQAS